jgi:hypothetical protein
MEDNKTNIKERLDYVFIEKMAFAVNRLTDEQRSKSLLRDCIGMQARDLLKLYMELENEFHIDFNPLVLEGNFDKYNCLLEYIISQTGEKNVN